MKPNPIILLALSLLLVSCVSNGQDTQRSADNDTLVTAIDTVDMITDIDPDVSYPGNEWYTPDDPGPTPDENGVYDYVDELPEFPGGNDLYWEYIKENLRYPPEALKDSIEGRVICKFVVRKDGSITDIIILRRSPDESLDEEALRLLNGMPKWKPGRHKGEIVDCWFAVAVSFILRPIDYTWYSPLRPED